MTDLHLVPPPNPVHETIDRLDTLISETLVKVRLERMASLDRDDRQSHRIANDLQDDLERALGRLRSERG